MPNRFDPGQPRATSKPRVRDLAARNANAALFTGGAGAGPSCILVHQPSKLLYHLIRVADLRKRLLQDFGMAERDARGCRVGLRQAERGCQIIGNGSQPLNELVQSNQGCFAQICGGPGTGLVPGPRSGTDLAQLRLRFRDQLGDVLLLGLIENLNAPLGGRLKQY